MRGPYRRLMVDLETGGTYAGCPIFSIGAVFFSASVLEWKGPTFYDIAARDSFHSQRGLVELPSTMDWWSKQSEQARWLLTQIEHPSAPTLAATLESFAKFVDENCDPAEVQVWGNGADFDNPILSHAYRQLGMTQPWGAYNGRCYRTLKGLFPRIKKQQVGTLHNALDDAVNQAEHAVRILKEIKA